MNRLRRRFAQLPLWNQRMRNRYVLDTVLAVLGALVAVGIIRVLNVYPRVPNSSFLSLLIVLLLAISRGRYAAICSAIISFVAFDYFLVPPLYKLSINNQDEWFALFIFLVTAIITGQLASAVKRRAEEASLRAQETQALYEVLSATSRESDLRRQLAIVARAIGQNFAFAGVRDCAIWLSDKQGLCTISDADNELRPSVEDEKKMAALVLAQGKMIDFYADSRHEHPSGTWFRRELTRKLAPHQYVRMIPLQLDQQTIGVLRLLMEDNAQQFLTTRRDASEHERTTPQATFFQTFLDQATALIERSALRQEALEVELLRRTDGLRSALVSSVSHDLRTPLAAIKASASSLLQDDVEWSEEERRSFAQAIEDESDRLDRLVGNLLDISRIEGGALKPEKEWYPINELIQDVLGHMQFILAEREVRTTLPEDIPPVELDYLQIDQVVTNLLENAVRYTPATAPIEIEVERLESSVCVSIADRGPGIPPGDLERIFDKFYRVQDGSRKKSGPRGSGLGLAVCRGLIEAHGGHIWAKNRPGGGTIFRFTLPVVDLAEGEEHE